MKSVRTHYDNLQVTRSASPEVIRAAYKGLSQRYHPDRNPDDRARCERRMKVINRAFKVLSDPQQRAEHDAWIASEEAAHAAEAEATQRSVQAKHHPPVEPSENTSYRFGNVQDSRQPSGSGYQSPQGPTRREEPETSTSALRSHPPDSTNTPQKTSGAVSLLLGLVVLACPIALFLGGLFLTAYTPWGFLLVLLSAIWLVWLYLRSARRVAQASAKSSTRGNPESKLATKEKPPMSGWMGLWIGVVAVVLIIAAMMISETREGRIAVIVGGVVLLFLITLWVIRDASIRNASGPGKNDLALLLTALVWGWFPFFIGLRPGEYTISPKSLHILGMLAVAALPAWAALDAWRRGADLSWKVVYGYLALTSLNVVSALTYLSWDKFQWRPWSGDRWLYGLTYNVGTLIGCVLFAALLAVALFGVAVLGSKLISACARWLGKSLSSGTALTLVLGWAITPATYLSLFLAGWVVDPTAAVNAVAANRLPDSAPSAVTQPAPPPALTPLQARAVEWKRIYPFLDDQSPQANNSAIDAVIARRNELIVSGTDAVIALDAAVREIAPRYVASSASGTASTVTSKGMTIKADQIPLAALLNLIAESGGKKIRIAKSVAPRLVSVDAANVPWDTLLANLAIQHEFAVIYTGDNGDTIWVEDAKSLSSPAATGGK